LPGHQVQRLAARQSRHTSELAYLEAHPADAFALIDATQAAIPNFETGLAETPGDEARSLNGAFHVFETHDADWLLVV
jgi:hypothetical protein